MDILDIKYLQSERTSYTLPVGIYELSDINKTLEYLLPDIVKEIITIDGIRLGSGLNTNHTLIFSRKSIYKQNWVLLDHIQFL